MLAPIYGKRQHYYHKKMYSKWKINPAIKAQEQRSGIHPRSISRYVRYFIDDNVHIIKFWCSSFLNYKMDLTALMQNVLCFQTEMKNA